jgi:hypothetical protein
MSLLGDLPHQGGHLLVGRLEVQAGHPRFEGPELGHVLKGAIRYQDDASGKDYLLPVSSGLPDDEPLLQATTFGPGPWPICFKPPRLLSRAGGHS